MPTPLQLRMGVEAPHRNRYLFSDHYLENILPDDPRWDQALAEAEAFCGWLRERYADEKDQLPDYNEDQLEEHWFKPILRQLGHVFETQASVPGLEAHAKRPDYVLFPDEAARQTAAGLQNQEDYAAEALAVGEVKRWDTPLGKKRQGRRPGGGPSFEDQNPSWQIDYYVRITGLDWGILTNGRLWRLVHADSSQRLNVYYEVDLVELLHRDDPGLMRYFVLFFRQVAFRPDAQGRVFLDDVLAGSNAYAVALGEDVEENVYRALERLMQGFLDLPGNELGPVLSSAEGADDLQRVHDNSLYLLYRLLFILYGESRGLLPMDRATYREHYSLEAIKRDIAEGNVPPASASTVVWGRVHNLFHIINGDLRELNRELGVPRYDGGLFDPRQHPFLEEKAVGDRALVAALELLSRRETESGREFVDYRTLSVRHLGSIYEGLLEYRPRLAEEPMVAVGDEWVPEAEIRPPRSSETSEVSPKVVDRRAPGEVYLETDRGERKATGSYYTPQYIVEYIVEHTLGPLVEEARERVKARAESAEDGQALRLGPSTALGINSGQALVDEILDLKCLDPAMGSGHFLVEATEFLARALATDPYVETEQVAEEDLTYWKRRVVERCIYGVDKNPLAVELAKLSLWLATVAADRPLSFLDHHLKCGDSLIGARVEDLGEVPLVMLSKRALQERKARHDAGARQANLFETRLIEKLPVVMGRILEITEVESKDYDTVRAKEAADRAVRELKAPFEAVADLWTSAYFGNEFVNGEYDEALMSIGQPDGLMALPAVRRARAMADERHFFHWELAFPEVFYDEHGRGLGEQAGFDAVVGNPPYVDSETMVRTAPNAREFIANHFNTASGNWDLYIPFWELAITLLRDRGRAALITPNKWISISYGQALRQFVARFVYEVGDFSRIRVFDDVGVFPIVAFVIKSENGALDIKSFARGYSVLFKQSVSSSFLDDDRNWGIILSQHLPIIQKIERISQDLSDEFCAEEAFTVSEAYELADLLHEETAQHFPSFKFVVTGTIDRYQSLWGFQPTRYLGTDYLKPMVDRSKLQNQFGRRYQQAQDRKVVISGIRHFESFLDAEGEYLAGKSTVIVRGFSGKFEARTLLAILNSTMMTWYIKELYGSLAMDAGINFTAPLVADLPIRHIDFTTPADEREELVAAGTAEAAEWIETAEKGPVLSPSKYSAASASFSAFSDSDLAHWLDQRLSAEPEQADVVHDLLAHLAERMMDTHEQKQERVETFWLDLEGVTDPDTFEDLSEHGKWGSSLWKAEPCRAFVDEESRSTRHLDESLGWNEGCFKAFVKMLAGRVASLSDVVGVYREHHPAYRRLVQRIAATDRLIDLIVYRLYGLTEEEVAVVEGNS